jgi:hypothetical protein
VNMRFFASLLFALCVVPVQSSHGLDASLAVARCAEESPVAAAEQCLKTLDSIKTQMTLPQAIVNSFGAWDIRQRQSSSEAEGTDVFLLLRESLVGAPTDNKGTLVLRCLDNSTGLYLGFESAVAKTETLVAYRFDNEPVKESVWTAGTDFAALFPDVSSIALAKDMVKFSSLRLWFFPKGGVPRTVSFDLRGLTNSIVPVQRACHWQ